MSRVAGVRVIAAARGAARRRFRRLRTRGRVERELVRRRLGAAPAAEADWYDDVYAGSEKYAVHYSSSPYLAVWEEIARRVPTSARILEIGCGTGQLAHLLRDRGVAAYLGFDFSATAVDMARRRVPDMRFEVADALTTELVDGPYDVVVCTEVLEHIAADLELLRRVRSGARVLATVPNFISATHLRWFHTAAGVRVRYRRALRTVSVTAFDVGGTSKLFLIDARR